MVNNETIKIKKKSILYIVNILIWIALSFFGITSIVNNLNSNGELTNPIAIFLLVVNMIFIVYFWLNGLKDIVYTFAFYIKKYRIIFNEMRLLKEPLKEKYVNAKVLLLYCTCDDFIEDSLFQSMQQDYDNYHVVILDDSHNDEFKNKINEFSRKYNIEIVRRKDREGFKAGNLNNYLSNKEDYDFFVVLDSDEIIPNDFIKKSLHYFSHYENIGILQANHISTRNKTKFMERFSVGVDAHWATYQSIKERYGFLSFLGHGAMISKECYDSVGGFPNIVAEDIAFTVEARLKGYYAVFANMIICQEEYPIDYFAFKKRHLRWTAGNLEFIKNYSSKIFPSKKMTWFEKLDIFLFTYSLPMASVFFLFLTINLIILPVLGYNAGYPMWLMIPTMIFLLAPMINDSVYLMGKMTPFKYIRYLFSSFLLYGSLYWLSFYGATRAWFGKKATFVVTPKKEESYTLFELIKGNIPEIVFSITLLIISLTFTKSFLPVILIIIPSLSGVYLASLYKQKTRKKKRKKIDERL